MGRSFGVLVVLIGLWVLAALPTRGPDADIPVSSAAARTTPLVPAGSDASMRIADSTATWVAPRSDDGQSATRPPDHKRAVERDQAARSRELESEPEAHSGAMPQSVPVPVAVSPPVSGNDRPAAERLQPSTPQQAAPATAAARTRASTALPDNKPPMIALAAPRIVGTALRDLASPPPGPAQTADQKTPSARPVASGARQEKPRAVTGKTSSLQALASAEVKSVPKAGVQSEPRSAYPQESRGESRPEPRLANRTAHPRQSAQRVVQATAARAAPVRTATARPQRARIALSYGAPAYVGRVYVQYPPQGFLVPSPSYYRRSQFHPETVWSAIRRSGL